MISIFNYNLCQGLISDWVRHEINQKKKKKSKSIGVLLHCKNYKNNVVSLAAQWCLYPFYKGDSSSQ